MIRWPYESVMRFRQADGSLKTARVRWYFTAPETPFLEVEHCYGSSAWYDPCLIELRDDAPGELLEGRKRLSKVLPPPPVGVPCGSEAQWRGE